MSKEELLILLTEECGEVIQAATKCIRFTWDEGWPGYGINHEVLAKEIGDLLGVVDALPLDKDIINKYRQEKIQKVIDWKEQWEKSKYK